jgi:gluconate 2-dehydrogenase gamma chain
MTDSTQPKPRRDFLLKSLVGAAGAATAAVPLAAHAQGQAGAASATAAAAPSTDAPAGYQWLRPGEQAFVEALVNHMCPADKLTPNGVDMGLNIYFDRTLAGNWGQGDRLYLQGPFKKGSANQGYQLGMGVNTTNKLNIVKFMNKPYRPQPVSIADLS